MTYKRYRPSWEGYMGDFLRDHVGINQLKPEHPFFDAIGLEKQLNENTTYYCATVLRGSEKCFRGY
ncbi:hypothetical protein [Photorhabdus sp. CRCIA-P01]|uniref:hypothetical protein n=1 Tax=Photorhabdus sp. CRCIA-P01 TaxID=2019570 RepID=UPI0018E55944